MLLSTAASLLLACTSVQAFSDTTAFVLFSTSSLSGTATDAQLQTSRQVIASANDALSSCPTTRYLLVSQPNVHASDIRGDDGCNMPALCRAITSDKTKGQYSVAEVVGQISKSDLADQIKAACLAGGKQAKVDEVELRHLPAPTDAASRADILANNDYELGRLLQTLGSDYTVLLFSDPNEFKTYAPSFNEPLNMELKRRSEPDQTVYIGSRASNSTDHRPLFQKYQFFTPGIFMALITMFVILSILAVGLKALSSLEVSYGAFDKEMGPAAQKKQL